MPLTSLIGQLKRCSQAAITHGCIVNHVRGVYDLGQFVFSLKLHVLGVVHRGVVSILVRVLPALLSLRRPVLPFYQGGVRRTGAVFYGLGGAN